MTPATATTAAVPGAAAAHFSPCSSTSAAVSPRRMQLPGRPDRGNAACRSAPRHAQRPRRNRYSKSQADEGWSTGLKLRRSWHVTSAMLWAILLAVLLCSRSVGAGSLPGQGSMVAERSEAVSLIYDMRPAPAPRVRLAKRQEDSDNDVSDKNALPSSRLSSVAAQGTATATSSGAIATASGTADSTLPTPFDTSLGNNFTSQSCPDFFDSFLSNQTFQDCLPFSLLLQTSNSFFTASRSLFRLTRTLDASCSADFDTCSALMTSLASRISADSTCGADLKMQNPQVLQAYHGFLAYAPLYRAGCLTDSDTGDYCFAQAVTNASAPTSSYVYYLPLGVQLPGGSRPACTGCLRDTMSVFAVEAGNGSQPISETYGQAADAIDMACGPNYVQQSVVTDSAAGSGREVGGPAALFTLGVMVFYGLGAV